MVVFYIILFTIAYVFVGGIVFSLIDLITDTDEMFEPWTCMLIWPACLIVVFIVQIAKVLRVIYDKGVDLCDTVIYNFKTKRRSN